jgi:hypothetical protein
MERRAVREVHEPSGPHGRGVDLVLRLAAVEHGQRPHLRPEVAEVLDRPLGDPVGVLEGGRRGQHDDLVGARLLHQLGVELAGGGVELTTPHQHERAGLFLRVHGGRSLNRLRGRAGSY